MDEALGISYPQITPINADDFALGITTNGHEGVQR
jgi:hypothetical protein